MHSEFQIDHFIIGRGNFTPYARYQQAVREMEKRERAAGELSLSIRELLLDIEAAESRWRPTRTGRERRDIDLTRKRAALAGARRALKENETELRRFTELAAAALRELGELTPERRAQLDIEMWESKLRAMVAVDLMVHHALSASTLELLVSVPAAMRQPILADMRQTLKAFNSGLDGPMVQALLGSDVATS